MYAIRIKTDVVTNHVYNADLSDVIFLAKLMFQLYSGNSECTVEVIGVPDDSVCYWSSVDLVVQNCIGTLSKGYISEVYSNAVDITIPTSMGDYTIGVYCYYTDAENLKKPTIGAIDYDSDNTYVQFSDDIFSKEEREALQVIVDHYDFEEHRFGHEIVT